MATTKPEQVPKELARRLVKLRKAKKLTQEDVQAETGIPSFYLSRIEHGTRKPTVVTLAKLARGLGVKLEDLFRGL